MPKVSVLMPVYKTEETHLKEAISSILNQTFKDFEFLILDDCPEDNREKIVKSFDDKRIRYLKNEQNLGITSSRNKLFDIAKGEYLAIFDHDDISLPARLEKQVAYLDANKDVGVVSCQVERFPIKSITNHPLENLEIKKHLMHTNVVAHTAMMIRRKVLLESGIRYENQYSPAEDYMLCLRLINHTLFHNIPEVLVKYRFFEGNTTCRQWDKMVNADAICRCIAAKEYPYLYSLSNINQVNTSKKWMKLFGFLPVIKIKSQPSKVKFYLFGVLLLFTIRG